MSFLCCAPIGVRTACLSTGWTATFVSAKLVHSPFAFRRPIRGIYDSDA